MKSSRHPTAEAREVQLETRRLNHAIAEKRARIQKLQGLSTPRRNPFSLAKPTVQVELDLPGLNSDSALVHGALIDTLHREVGLLGAVTTDGPSLKWKALDTLSNMRGLEIEIEASEDSARVRLKNHWQPAAKMRNLAVSVGVTMLSLVPILLLASLFPESGQLVAMVSLMTVLVATLVANIFLRRRAAKVQLETLSASIAESLPLPFSGARVELDNAEEAELLVAEPNRLESALAVS